MRKWIRVSLVGALALVLAIVFLRWPRIEPGAVMVTRSRSGYDSVEVECRMRRPFQVALSHWLKEHDGPLPATGIRVGAGGKMLRKERGALFQSHYDFLRGEYVITLRLTRDDSLVVEANGQRV